MKISIAFLTYNQSTCQYLPYFLPSLEKALLCLNDKIDVDILILDNSENFNNNYSYVNNFFSNSKFNKSFSIIKSENNLGFSKAFNILINKSIQLESSLFLALNPDIVLERDSIQKLISIFTSDLDNFKKISSLSPKILRWDFENNQKTNHIDSLGIGMSSYHRFFDIGQGRIDKDNKNKISEIFGSSGAMSLYNLSALKDVAYNNGQYLEFFDELMFMYKEDVDLAYRFNLAGWKSYLISEAVVYHHRTLDLKSKRIINLFFKKNKLRSWSFLNQLIILIKFRKIKTSFKVRFLSTIRFLFLLDYGLFFQFKQIRKLFKIRKEISKRQKLLIIRQ